MASMPTPLTDVISSAGPQPGTSVPGLVVEFDEGSADGDDVAEEEGEPIVSEVESSGEGDAG